MTRRWLVVGCIVWVWMVVVGINMLIDDEPHPAGDALWWLVTTIQGVAVVREIRASRTSRPRPRA